MLASSHLQFPLDTIANMVTIESTQDHALLWQQMHFPSLFHLTRRQAPVSIPGSSGQGLAANQVKRTVSVTQLAERASMLKTSITALERHLVHLNGQ